MKKRTLLIATTNPGKAKEIKAHFKPLNFNVIALEDLDMDIVEPEEYGKTIEENALIKAKYYSAATGHLTLADDAGLFVEALDGWPGVTSARIADTREERMAIVLSKLAGKENRNAAFRICSALYDPKDDSTHVTSGRMPFVIAEAPVTENLQTDWGYTPIMFLPEIGKVYGELSQKETKEYSHRYRSLRSMLYYIEANYAHKNFPIGVSFVIDNGKILMQLRNDPGNTNFHKKWEFPGGGIDFGETMHEHVARETKEESGLEVEVVYHLQHIQIESSRGRKRPYQIILLAHICKVIGGEAKPCDEEVLELGWFDLDDVVNHDLVGNNKAYFSKVLPEIKAFLETNSL